MHCIAYSNGHSWEDDWESPAEAAMAYAEDRVSRGKAVSPVEVRVWCKDGDVTLVYTVNVTPREGFDCEATLVDWVGG